MQVAPVFSSWCCDMVQAHLVLTFDQNAILYPLSRPSPPLPKSATRALNLFCSYRSLGGERIFSSYQKSKASNLPYFGNLCLPFQKAQSLAPLSFCAFGGSDSCVYKVLEKMHLHFL